MALTIKSVFLNVSLHLGRDQVPHRLPFFDQLSDLCRGDIEKRDLFKIDLMAREVDPGLLSGVISKIWDQGLWER
jgi:hypothetical protein